MGGATFKTEANVRAGGCYQSHVLPLGGLAGHKARRTHTPHDHATGGSDARNQQNHVLTCALPFCPSITASIPPISTPEVFGLHPNAEISYSTNAARNLWKNLIDLQPRVGGGGGGKQSREAYISQIALDVDQRLPKQPFDLAAVQRDFNGVPTPTQVRRKETGDLGTARTAVRLARAIRDAQHGLRGRKQLKRAMSEEWERLHCSTTYVAVASRAALRLSFCKNSSGGIFWWPR